MSATHLTNVITGFEGFLHDVSQKAEKIRKRSLVYIHSGEIPDVEPPDPAVIIEPASESVISLVCPPGANRDKYLQFLDRGYHGVIAHDGAELISRGWVVPPEAKTVPRGIPDWVAELDVYWFTHDRTTERYRELGWHTCIIARRLEWVYDRDPTATVYIDTTAENPSRFSFESTGFTPHGTMTTYHLGHPSATVKQVGVWNPEAEHPPLPNTTR